jgi:hypothetical protein
MRWKKPPTLDEPPYQLLRRMSIVALACITQHAMCDRNPPAGNDVSPHSGEVTILRERALDLGPPLMQQSNNRVAFPKK